MRPLGALPALKARTSLPNFLVRWLSIPLDRTLRTELCVQRIRTLTVMGGNLSNLFLQAQTVETFKRQHDVHATLHHHCGLVERLSADFLRPLHCDAARHAPVGAGRLSGLGVKSHELVHTPDPRYGRLLFSTRSVA